MLLYQTRVRTARL